MLRELALGSSWPHSVYAEWRSLLIPSLCFWSALQTGPGCGERSRGRAQMREAGAWATRGVCPSHCMPQAPRTPFSPLFFSLFNWSSIHQLFMEACAKCSFFKWGAWIFIILGTMLYFSFHMVFEMFIMLPFGKKDLFIDVIKSSITLGSHNHNQHQ